MATTATKISGARTYRIPLPSAENFPAFDAGTFADEILESAINDNDPDHSLQSYMDHFGVGPELHSLTAVDLTRHHRTMPGDDTIPSHGDLMWPGTSVRGHNAVHLASQPNNWIEISPTGRQFLAGSFAMGTHIQSADHFAKFNDVAILEPMVTGTWSGNFNRHPLERWTRLERGPGSGTSISGEINHAQIRQMIEAHGLLITRPDLTARIALRLADIPEIGRAEDSVFPSEDVINATIRVAGYLPATTAAPQIELDDSMGSISLVWRDKSNENVFSLEIPNSRFAVGVGFGTEFLKFKAWRHLISDERKIVAEIEASEATRKLLRGA
jgi:hypothetical protein